MELNWFTMYLLINLDSIVNVLQLITIVAFFGGVACFLLNMFFVFDNIPKEDKVAFIKSNFEFRNNKCFLVFVIFLFLTGLVPTTKQAAVIILVPAIVNNENVKNIGENSLGSLEKFSEYTVMWLNNQIQEIKNENIENLKRGR